MKINNKGYASTIIMFSILTLFLISMLMLVKTMNNSSSLNKKITEKVVDNIDYDASGTVQGRLNELEIKYTNLQNQLSNTKKEIINEIYPVGSIYISEKDDTVEKIQSKFGGTWEKYAQGRTLIGEGIGTDSNGLVKTFENNVIDGEYVHTLSSNEIASHTHSIPSLSGTTGSTGSGYSLHHTCQTKTTSSSGNHSHSLYKQVDNNSGTSLYVGGGNSSVVIYYKTDSSTTTLSAGAHTHTYPDCYLDSLSGVQSHSHTFSTGTSTTGSTGENTAHNNMEPYIVTYIYKRIK